EEGKYQLVSPDIATCPQCLEEIFNPADRRYRYAFTNCTNCGPRFTIIEDIPYDRPATTMRRFKMCPDCRKEYDDPLNRRFHAQPNACPSCGPTLALTDGAGKSLPCPDVIEKTADFLRQGKIIAIKGLGGFLLACDATNESAVTILRQRKHRPSKPFAVMLPSLDEVDKHCYVNNEEARLLAAPESPIVLLRWRKESSIAQIKAPDLKYLGIMLPYTPLHHLLMREVKRPLIMTSGNLSEEPIARDNAEALRRLGGIADYFLIHDRDIYARYDDSVVMVERGVPQLLRRARGYAPYPIRLPYQSRLILACGAEEKNTFCLTRDNYAFLSQHIGDLENMETLEHFENTIDLYKRLFRIEPEAIACDMHPEYLATKYAREQVAACNLRLVPVQHHHAHIVSGMVDNGIDTPVIGVAFDGTGYGTDGNLWGGEFMVADYRQFTRAVHFQYLPLPGGVLAIKKPYRAALGYLLALGLDTNLPALNKIVSGERTIIENQLSRKINSPLTSSCGRLFDVVAALLGVRGEINYSAQAAIELEMLAADDEEEVYPFNINEQDGMKVILIKDLLSAIIDDIKESASAARISARFHNTIARIINDICAVMAIETGIQQIVLSGGVFQNRLLLRKIVALLESGGFKVYTHRMVPCNDGGISLGQAVIANFTKGIN
ncbi:MAG: carbamoyltransferase HypF, partial [Dehalococcoidales bacterium]|nr:carbamoyltransferase HypF [Dehalococcoidales bacterium]